MEQDTRKTIKSYHRIIPLLYLIAMIMMALIIIFNIFLRNPKEVSYGLEKFQSMNTHWFTADGTEFKISEIDKLRTGSSDNISIYYQLPNELKKAQSIIFRSKNCFVKVLADGKTLYETEAVSAPFYNHSPGTRWNVVTLSEQNKNQTIELQITQAYQDGRAKVDNFYIGDHAAVILHLIESKAFGFAISLLIFFVGILFVVTWIILNWKRALKDNSLLWLAVFAMIASGWCLLETNLFQFFSKNLELIQVCDNMLLVLGGIPLFLYMESVFQIFRFRLVRILCGLNIGYVLLATLSQLLGIWDFHQTLNGAIFTYGAAIIIMTVSLIRQRSLLRASSLTDGRFFSLLQLLGVVSLGIGLLSDLIRYLSTDVMDRAFYIRIGLLCFIVLFGAGNIIQMIHLVQRGLEADFISQLAYQDGLTRTGNRTAYMEKLEQLGNRCDNESLCFVMFDINDLKWVNDNYGHQVGDELILHCAELIHRTFSSGWNVYRIGGDEFVALIHGEHTESAYQTASQSFYQAIETFNASGTFICPIIIAHGAAFISTITKDTLAIAEKEADLNMYKNKYELKANFPEKGPDNINKENYLS